jgi:translocation and assembly module TamB
MEVLVFLGRVLRVLAKTLAHSAVFVTALVVGLALHLNAAPLRRAVALHVATALAPVLSGRLQIDSVGRLGFDGIDRTDVVVLDPSGAVAGRAFGVNARIDLRGLLRSVFAAKGPLVIDLADVSIDAIDLNLDVAPDGTIGVVRAFTPKPTSSSPGSPGRDVHVALPRIRVRHAWGHGQLAAGIALDADANAVQGSLLVDTPKVTVHVTHVDLLTRGMPLGADADGSLQGDLALPAPSGEPFAAKALWSGSVAKIGETASATFDGDILDASVDAPHVPPEAIQALWPASPIASPAALHLDAKGTLPRLAVHLTSSLDKATLDVSGPVVIGPAQSADLHVEARDVDLHTIVFAAPVSALSATADVALTHSALGVTAVSGTIQFPGGQIAHQSIPAAKIEATFTDDPVKGMRAQASASAREPGAPTFLTAQLAPKGKSFQVTFSANTRVAALHAVKRLRTGAQGSSELQTRGTIDFSRDAMDVSLSATIEDFRQGAIEVKHATIEAHAQGSPRAPQLDLEAHGHFLDLGGYRFRHAKVEIHGPATGATLVASLNSDEEEEKNEPALEIEGLLAVGSVTTITGVRVRVARADEHIHIHVAIIKIAGGEVAIDPIEVEGLGGELHGSFHSSFHQAHLQVSGQGIDLARFGRVSRLHDHLAGCLLGTDVDITLRGDTAEGHAILDLTKCKAGDLAGVSGGLQTTFDGRRISGQAHAELDGVGALSLTTGGIEIGGKGPIPENYKLAWGRVQFDGNVDLAALLARLPRGTLPLDHAQGRVSIRGHVQRDSPTDDTPGVILSASTAGLGLVGESKRTTGLDGTAVIAPAEWRFEGVDLGLDARIDGESGFGSVAARLNDPHGQLAALDVKSGAVPYAAIFDAPSRALTLLENVPFNARVVVPTRDMKELPPLLALKGVRGALSADVSATGTALNPTANLSAKLTGLRVSRGLAFPIDLTLDAKYDAGHGEATLTGASHGRQVITAQVKADAKMAAILAGDADAWTASARAHLEALQLESIAALSDRQVTGKIAGDVTLDGLHQDGRASLTLDMTALQVGDVRYPTGNVRATVDGKGLVATVQLVQADGGSLDAALNAGTVWGAAVLPHLDASRPLSGNVTAKNLRMAILLPFVDDTFTELDGQLQAAMKLTVDPKTGSSQAEGSLAVSRGRFELGSMGGEFHDVAATAVFTPDGVVKLEKVSLRGMSGKLLAAASARLNNLALVAANATVQIPSSSPLLLTVEGAQVGTVDGNMTVALTAAPTKTRVDVQIPVLHVELPLTSTRDVQQLGEINGVTIGAEKSGSVFIAQRLDAPKDQPPPPTDDTLEVAVHLGKDVQVKKGADLKVSLAGTTTITAKNDVRAAGQVRLLNGTIDVQGKAFDIESGTVTFQGDPSDPQVVVTASWTASDGTKVYAEMRGTLKNPRVTLRSEPTLSQNEIISLLVYGSADAANPGSSSTSASGNQQTSAAAGVAGGAATQPLNRALENLGLGGVSTRVDTSSTTPRADVEVQIARDISLQIAQVMGAPPPGANPDTTLFTLNWRFIRAWSAETTIGNAGTSILDLIWQYRY